MSIAETVLRIVTVNALRGATLAGDQVLDDPIDPAQEAEERKSPILAVFTGRSQGEPDGTDLIGQDLELDLTVQVYFPTGIRIPFRGLELGIDVRGSGAGFSLGVVERQIIRALMAGQSDWCEAWRDLVLRIHESTGQTFLFHRGGDDSAIRLAAREFSLRLCPLADPPLGGPVPASYENAFALMRTRPELAPVVDWLEEETSGPAGLTDWQKHQAELGTTRRTLAGLGLAPADRPKTDPSVPFAGVAAGGSPEDPEFTTAFGDEA